MLSTPARGAAPADAATSALEPQRFKSARQAQRLLSPYSRILNHVQLRRSRVGACQHRAAREAALRTWRKVVAGASAA